MNGGNKGGGRPVEFTVPLCGAQGVDACQYYPEMLAMPRKDQQAELIASLVRRPVCAKAAVDTTIDAPSSSIFAFTPPPAAKPRRTVHDTELTAGRHARAEASEAPIPPPRPGKLTPHPLKPWRGHDNANLKLKIPHRSEMLTFPSSFSSVAAADQSSLSLGPPREADSTPSDQERERVRKLARLIATNEVLNITDKALREFLWREIRQLQARFAHVDWTQPHAIASGELGRALSALLTKLRARTPSFGADDGNPSSPLPQCQRFQSTQMDPVSFQDCGSSIRAGHRLANYKVDMMTHYYFFSRSLWGLSRKVKPVALPSETPAFR